MWSIPSSESLQPARGPPYSLRRHHGLQNTVGYARAILTSGDFVPLPDRVRAVSLQGAPPYGCRSMPAALFITVVVSHFDTRRTLANVLRSLGHRVDEAGSAANGLSRLRAAAPDTLICDIDLLDASGWDLMRQAQLAPCVFAVAISMWEEPADRARSRAVGFKRHMKTPLHPEEIENALAEAATWKESHGPADSAPVRSWPGSSTP